MAKETPILLPKHKRTLKLLGDNIRLARKRRGYTTIQVSERAGIVRSTLYAIEKGSEGVSIGNLLKVLAVLGLEKDLEQVGADDVLGRKLADASLLNRKDKNEP
ncbi:MAG: helix-turn-helix transcriptional regulator [Verrucomicrobiales bacterium]|nr:helix-turn-helix transcriptional regulator [Verrucomicrobiales bacterium]